MAHSVVEHLTRPPSADIGVLLKSYEVANKINSTAIPQKIMGISLETNQLHRPHIEIVTVIYFGIYFKNCSSSRS